MARFRGMLAAGPWTVETVELDMVPRRHGAVLVGQYPKAAGHWWLVRSPGMVWWVRPPAESKDPAEQAVRLANAKAELIRIGVPVEDLKTVRTW